MKFEELVDDKWLADVEVQEFMDQCYYRKGVAKAPVPLDLSGTPLAGRYIGITFHFEQDNRVEVFIPTNATIDATGGSREQFKNFWGEGKSGAITFQRELVISQQGNIPGLRTDHFSKNYGEPYNTTMETQTTPLEEAPSGLRAIHKLLSDVVSAWTGTESTSNDYLVLGYMSSNHMNYHHDGDDDVKKGTPIASFSIGEQATMGFAYSSAHISGRKIGKQKRTGYPQLVPGTRKEREKK